MWLTREMGKGSCKVPGTERRLRRRYAGGTVGAGMVPILGFAAKRGQKLDGKWAGGC